MDSRGGRRICEKRLGRGGLWNRAGCEVKTENRRRAGPKRFPVGDRMRIIIISEYNPVQKHMRAAHPFPKRLCCHGPDPQWRPVYLV